MKFNVCVSLASIHAVNIALEPPATNTTGVLSFRYCPTASESVNVTCTVQGIEAVYVLEILPQVGIGSDLFDLTNGTKHVKWMIKLFSQNHTFLHFALPLTTATSGKPIYCKSEKYSSPRITLLAGKNAN